MMRKQEVEAIRQKPRGAWTEEEAAVVESFETQRLKKNSRSRELRVSKKRAFEEIQAKPSEERTEHEVLFLEQFLEARRRKSQCDHLRRERRKRQRALLGTSHASMAAIMASRPTPHPYRENMLQQRETTASTPPSPPAALPPWGVPASHLPGRRW